MVETVHQVAAEAHRAAIAAEHAAAAARTASKTFEHAHTSDTQVAVIGIIGALVGGLITGGFQLLGDIRKNRRQEEEQRRRARGMGRALQDYLSMWLIMVTNRVDGETNSWWDAAQEPNQYWDSDDIKLVAASLDAEQWRTVRSAMKAARNVAANRLMGLKSNELPKEFFAIPGIEIRREMNWLSEGSGVLVEVFG
jgi:hypothetical protein